jgi:hypothetical protein
MTNAIKERWPDEAVTGFLGPDRVLAMTGIFVGRVHTLSEVVEELKILFDEPDWSSQEAQEMLSLVGPLEYGELGKERLVSIASGCCR